MIKLGNLDPNVYPSESKKAFEVFKTINCDATFHAVNDIDIAVFRNYLWTLGRDNNGYRKTFQTKSTGPRSLKVWCTSNNYPLNFNYNGNFHTSDVFGKAAQE